MKPSDSDDIARRFSLDFLVTGSKPNPTAQQAALFGVDQAVKQAVYVFSGPLLKRLRDTGGVAKAWDLQDSLKSQFGSVSYEQFNEVLKRLRSDDVVEWEDSDPRGNNTVRLRGFAGKPSTDV